MKNEEIIACIDFFRWRIQEIDDALVEIRNELENNSIPIAIVGNLNFSICMLYEEGLTFIRELCKHKKFSINSKKYVRRSKRLISNVYCSIAKKMV